MRALPIFLILSFSAVMVLCLDYVPDYSTDFPHEGLSFESHFSWDICAKAKIDVIPPRKSSKYDYGVVINELLTGMARHGGGTVQLPNGIYYLQTPIKMLDGTCLRGSNQKKTVLRVHESLTNAVLIQNTVRVTLSLLTIDGRSRVDYGVNIFRSKFVLLDGINVKRTGTSSVYIQSSLHTAVDSVHLQRSADSCILLNRTASTAIVGSKGRQCGNHGILVYGALRLRVEGTRLSNGVRCGISVGEAGGGLKSARVHITTSRLNDFRRSGICVSKTESIIIDHNKLTSRLYPHADCVDIGVGVQTSTMIRNLCDGGGIDTKPLKTSEIRALEI